MKFSIFICTHGRPHAQHTLNALRSAGFNGKVVLVLDDEDETYYDYMRDVSGHDGVYVFNKQHYIDTVDVGTDKPKRKAILYAKCACEDLAYEMSLDAFVIADDDLTGFRYRYEDGGSLRSLPITAGMDMVMDALADFVIDCGICAVSPGTSQMFMGGKLSDEDKGNNRVPFNFVVRNRAVKFDWRSEIYEDSISAIMGGIAGKYMMQVPLLQINMKPLYAGAEGGMSDLYNNVTNLEKVFPVIKYLPSCMKLYAGKDRIVYSIAKNNSVPKLIGSRHKSPVD